MRRLCSAANTEPRLWHAHTHMRLGVHAMQVVMGKCRMAHLPAVAWSTRGGTELVCASTRCGFGINSDGTEDHLVDVVLPGTGKRIFPGFGEGQPKDLCAQEGQGLRIIGAGKEVLIGPNATALTAALETKAAALAGRKQQVSELVVVHKPGDMEIFFPTEREKMAAYQERTHEATKELAERKTGEQPCGPKKPKEKTWQHRAPKKRKVAKGKQAKSATKSPTKKAKKVPTSTQVVEEDSEEEVEAGEEAPFDEADFKDAALTMWPAPITLVHERPRELDAALVGRHIAFLWHTDHWELGTIKSQLNPKKAPRSKFNYSIYYGEMGGEVSTRLSLSDYGVTDGRAPDLGTWVLFDEVSAR